MGCADQASLREAVGRLLLLLSLATSAAALEAALDTWMAEKNAAHTGASHIDWDVQVCQGNLALRSQKNMRYPLQLETY